MKLSEDFLATCDIWLMLNEGLYHVGWFLLQQAPLDNKTPVQWLEINVQVDFKAKVMTATFEEMAVHINQNFDGWEVERMNYLDELIGQDEFAKEVA